MQLYSTVSFIPNILILLFQLIIKSFISNSIPIIVYIFLKYNFISLLIIIDSDGIISWLFISWKYLFPSQRIFSV